MDRRSVLRGLGAAASLTLLPEEVRAGWARVASNVPPGAGLSPAQLAMVSTLADVIIPRTDTPGALDVRVPAFVDAVVSESWSASDRAQFHAGLEALRDRLAGASGADLTAMIDSIERSRDRRTEPARTYWRLKSLIVHGYFTSEQVSTDVLRVEVMPGRFEGAAPMPTRARPQGSGGARP